MMRKMRVNRNRRRGGFTLLEVLLVVAILGLLAAFVVPSLVSTGDKAKIDMAKGMVASGGTLATQVELYRQAIGKYPDELKYLVEKPEDEDAAAKWAGPYITDLGSLKDPWGKELQYKANDDAERNQGRYDLWSMGPDGEDGSDDDIGNWATDDK